MSGERAGGRRLPPHPPSHITPLQHANENCQPLVREGYTSAPFKEGGLPFWTHVIWRLDLKISANPPKNKDFETLVKILVLLLGQAPNSYSRKLDQMINPTAQSSMFLLINGCTCVHALSSSNPAPVFEYFVQGVSSDRKLGGAKVTP